MNPIVTLSCLTPSNELISPDCQGNRNYNNYRPGGYQLQASTNSFHAQVSPFEDYNQVVKASHKVYHWFKQTNIEFSRLISLFEEAEVAWLHERGAGGKITKNSTVLLFSRAQRAAKPVKCARGICGSLLACWLSAGAFVRVCVRENTSTVCLLKKLSLIIVQRFCGLCNYRMFNLVHDTTWYL